MRPTKGDVHINKPLTNVSIAYIQSESAFIASRVFPVVPVQNSSDAYFTFDKGDWFRDEAKPRAPGTEAEGGGYDIGNDNYSCKTYAWKKDVSDPVVANADAPITPFRTGTRYVTHKLLLQREVEWVRKYFTTSVWDTDFTPGTLWSASGGTPILDVKTKITAVQEATGFRPNKLVLARKVLDALETAGDIVDRIKYTSRESITPEILARMFGVDEVVVADAVKNTAKKGATAALSLMHGKNALLVYTTNSPTIDEPTGGYIFNWAGLVGSQNSGMRMKRYRIESRESDRIEGQISYDMKLTGSDLGVFFEDVVA